MKYTAANLALHHMGDLCCTRIRHPRNLFSFRIPIVFLIALALVAEAGCWSPSASLRIDDGERAVRQLGAKDCSDGD